MMSLTLSSAPNAIPRHSLRSKAAISMPSIHRYTYRRLGDQEQAANATSQVFLEPLTNPAIQLGYDQRVRSQSKRRRSR